MNKHLLWITLVSCISFTEIVEAAKTRLSQKETREWLEGYYDEITHKKPQKERVYSRAKMKEWCDRCTPQDAYKTLFLDKATDLAQNSALHLFCKEADTELTRHVLKKFFPQGFKRGDTLPIFSGSTGPWAFDNVEEKIPTELIPFGNLDMYLLLDNYGFGVYLDDMWKLEDSYAEFLAKKTAYFKAQDLEKQRAKKAAQYNKEDDAYKGRFYKTIGVKVVAAFFIGFIGYKVYSHYKDKQAIDASFNSLVAQSPIR